MGLPAAARYDSQEPPVDGCCNPEIYGILTSILLQDLPFLCVRLTLIFYYHVVSYTNMFFTSKNTLVIVLLIYRLIVVHSEARKRRRKYLETVYVSSPLNNLKSNGHSKNGRGLKHKKSKSVPNVPNVLHMTSECNTLPKKNKKKTSVQSSGQPSPSSTELPAITNSFSENNVYTIDNGRPRKSVTSLYKTKSSTSLEKHKV